MLSIFKLEGNIVSKLVGLFDMGKIVLEFFNIVLNYVIVWVVEFVCCVKFNNVKLFKLWLLSLLLLKWWWNIWWISELLFVSCK